MATALWWSSPSELAEKAVAASFAVALGTGLVIVLTLVNGVWMSGLESASDVDRVVI